jgi:hypothetical protein
MKVGPKAGTRYNVARSANIENPTEVYRAGKGGTGSIKGLTTNQAAIGMVEQRKIVGSGRGDKAALLVAPAIVCGRVQKCAQRSSADHTCQIRTWTTTTQFRR